MRIWIQKNQEKEVDKRKRPLVDEISDVESIGEKNPKKSRKQRKKGALSIQQLDIQEEDKNEDEIEDLSVSDVQRGISFLGQILDTLKDSKELLQMIFFDSTITNKKKQNKKDKLIKEVMREALQDNFNKFRFLGDMKNGLSAFIKEIIKVDPDKRLEESESKMIAEDYKSYAEEQLRHLRNLQNDEIRQNFLNEYSLGSLQQHKKMTSQERKQAIVNKIDSEDIEEVFKKIAIGVFGSKYSIADISIVEVVLECFIEGKELSEKGGRDVESKFRKTIKRRSLDEMNQ